MDKAYLLLLIVHAFVAVQAGPRCTVDPDRTQPQGTFNQIVLSVEATQGRSHECLRPCGSTGPMTCNYTLEVQWYTTMSRECYDCPCNLEDCVRERCLTADGVERPIVVANRALPGPPIEVCKGDRIIVDVINEMENSEGISIHWHGLLQKNTPYMDGTSMITQCPITPHTSFRYDFLADKVGTHWWHGHSGFTRVDGLFGQLIVREPDQDDPHRDLYDYDLPAHSMVLSDWLHKTSIVSFVEEHHKNNFPPPPSILINGKSQFAIYVNESGNTSYVTPREVFEVQKGNSYRFRVISAGFKNVAMKISVEGHNLTLISSDGGDIQPMEVDAFVAYAGERYDFVLNASQEVGNYWLRVVGDRGLFEVEGLAIIRYKGAPPSNPITNPALEREGVIYQRWNTPASENVITVDQLRAIDNATLPQEGKKTAYVTADYSKHGDDRFWYDFRSPQMNARAFIFPEYTLLSQHEDGSDNDLCDLFDQEIDEECDQEFCRCTQVLQVEVNQTLEIILIDERKVFVEIHPFHLHGHSFRVLAQGKFNDRTSKQEVIQMDQNGTIVRNYDNPPIKDTVIVPSPGYTVIEFVADNPGWWFFHCHVQFHADTGMALVIRVGNQSHIPPVPPNFPRCGSFPSPPEVRTAQPTPTPPTTGRNTTPPISNEPLSSTVIALAFVVGVLGLIVIAQFCVIVSSRLTRSPKRDIAMTSHTNKEYVHD